ncbi:hypothetical protein CROQUDRAFT_684611 [Cronartium quercuum f. sp. fusiforme G11]|uniref:Uncharacterized protein n=1 Tax=Cronartium quercuum f. sp. fusiforme G11 TaxID=708437 RepID=A0A9P6TGH6_9BASI|nr:hypothetical protein CROQUDRAFT_684611 [Cronartium quercuum f. sp. fusiforme G11]
MQGLNVQALFFVVDLLVCGPLEIYKAKFFKSENVKNKMLLFYGFMKNWKKVSDTMPLSSETWSTSPERLWLRNHHDLNSLYEKHFKLTIMEGDYYKVTVPQKVLAENYISTSDPWWTFGDFLMWTEQDLPIKIMHQIGSELKLKTVNELLPERILNTNVNWKSLISHLNSQEQQKVKNYFIERSTWNSEKTPASQIVKLRDSFMKILGIN